jgi:DNA-binding NarL/FixJ family response regulator
VKDRDSGQRQGTGNNVSELTPIVIIEPNGLMRAVLRGAFGGASGWEVLASVEAVDEPLLIRTLSGAQSTPLLLCAAPPDDGLIPALAEMRQRFPGLAVALLGPMPTMTVAQQLMQMLRSSTGGFVYLEHQQVTSVRDIEAACRVAASGRAVLDLPVLLDLAEGIEGTVSSEQRPADDETLLAMLADGMTDEAIAQRLDIPLALLLVWLDDLYQRVGALDEDRDPRVFAVVHYLTQTGRAPLRLGRDDAPPPAAPVEPEGDADLLAALEPAPPAAPTSPSNERDDAGDPLAEAEPQDVGAASVIDWTPRESTVDDEELEDIAPLTQEPEEPEPPTGPRRRAARPRDAEEPVVIEIPPASTRTGRTPQRAEPLDDEEFARFAQYGAPEDTDAARRIVEWAREHQLTCRFGTGRREGSFTVTYEHGSLSYWLLTVWTAGSVEVEFGALRAKAPFSSVEARNELAERVRKVPGAQVREADLHNRSRMSLSALASDGGWRMMREALDWAVGAIRERAA